MLTDNNLAVLGPQLIRQLRIGQTDEGFFPCEVLELSRDHVDAELIPALT